MATALPILDIQEPGADLARKTVFIKLRLGLLGNSRKVSSSQVEVNADKALIRVSKNLLDSPELQAIRSLEGDIRRYLYDTCLPFDVGIHLLPLGLIEAVDERLREFKAQRDELVEAFFLAYPRLCQEAAVRLRTLHNPADYPPVDEEGMHLQLGDVLVTSTDGGLAFIMRDGTRVSLGPQTELSVDQFAYDPSHGKFALLLKLGRGILAYVSGKIATFSPESVRVQTPVATIGVRGTKFVVGLGVSLRTP